MNFVELEAKAVRQWEAIEERRRALVMQTFSDGGVCAPSDDHGVEPRR